MLKSNFAAPLAPGDTHMHPEDLNNIWICSNCQTAFAFHTDIMDHVKTTRHMQIKKFDLNTGRILEVRAMV
jgi:hypothetical protein